MVGLLIYARWKTQLKHGISFSTPHFHPKEVIFQLPFTFVQTLSSQVFAFAFTAAMSFLPEGSFASYQYARQLVNKCQGIILQPIGVVFFNSLSDSIASGSQQVRGYARHALALSIAVATLCVVPLATSGDYLLVAAWGGKKFPVEMILQTHVILIALACMLIFNAQSLVTRRTNLALKIVIPQFVAGGIALLICAAVCRPIVSTFGLTGAVLIQLLAMMLSAGFSILVLWFYFPRHVAILPHKELTQWVFSGLIGFGASWLVREALSVEYSAGRIQLFMTSVVLAGVGSSVCFAVSWLLKTPESREIAFKVRKQLANKKSVIFKFLNLSNDSVGESP